MENAEGWDISGNHLYGVKQDALDLQRIYGTSISGNYVEDFGDGQSSGTWYGLAATAQDGPGSSIVGNKIFNVNGESGARYVYLAITGTNSGTGYASVTGNTIQGNRQNDVGLSFTGRRQLAQGHRERQQHHRGGYQAQDWPEREGDRRNLTTQAQRTDRQVLTARSRPTSTSRLAGAVRRRGWPPTAVNGGCPPPRSTGAASPARCGPARSACTRPPRHPGGGGPRSPRPARRPRC